MRKVALLAVVGLLCISLSSLAGEVVTNDTGADATGLRVVFSVPVKITAFGDTLMQIDPTSTSTEFVFSGGTVSPWGSHWMSWTPAAASILNHEWLRNSRPAIKKSTLDLPSTTVTQFPLSVAQAEPGVDTDTPYYVLPVEQYSPQDELPVDGMSSGSVPLNWWYSFDRTENGPKFHGLEPIQKDGERFMQYTYPDDGNVRTVSSQFTDPVDASSYKALVLVARADHAIGVEVNLGYYDHNLPATEDGEPCGSSDAVFATEILLDQQERVYVIPLTAFDVNSWVIAHKPGASTDPNLKELLEFKITLGDEGTIEILRVAFAKTMPKAVTTGNPPVINDYYFQQPAYVMQGVGDTDGIYALPLKGIPELGTGYVAEVPDGGDLTWSVTTSAPGIGAGFQDETLYIWGADASWSGYGETTLMVTDAEGMSDSVTIPVTVFRDDKTLINAEGKKDYFVPWSPELDINRILSVEEHMRKYNKDEGNLDRSIQWSRWKKMESKNRVELATFWNNDEHSNGVWTRASQYQLVDVLFRDLVHLGVNAISVYNEYYIVSREDTTIVPLTYHNLPGPTKTPEEEAYIVNEAHRLGFEVTTGNFVSIGNDHEWAELFYASPKPLISFLSSRAQLNQETIPLWSRLGVDCVEPCPVLASVNSFNSTQEEAQAINNAMEKIAASARLLYPGALFVGSGYGVNLFPGELLTSAPFQDHFDIIGMGGWNLPRLSQYANPTVQQLVKGWKSIQTKALGPFQKQWNKPVILYEVGCPSVRGCSNYGTLCIQLPFYSTAPQSLEDMERFFRSNVTALDEMEGFYGTRWSWFPLSRHDTGAVEDRGMNFRLKIEAAMQEAFLGQVSPRKIEIDGHLDDWDLIESLGSDARGDSRGTNDLVEMRFTSDSDYLYFLIEYASPPTGYLSLEMDLTGDALHDVSVLLEDVGDDWWWNEAIYLAKTGHVIGFADAMNSDMAVELRVPILFLSALQTVKPIRMRVVHANSNWKLEDQTAWFVLPGT